MVFALAVDLGGTKVEACLVDEDGALLPGSRFRSPTGPGVSRAELESAVGRVVTDAAKALPAGTSVRGMGIGSAGPIDGVHGTVSPLNLAGSGSFPIVEVVERAALAQLGGEGRAILALDGLCITLAEHWLGAGRDAESMMGMVVSTGIGGGIISRGRAVTGSTGNAGHIGQVEVAGFAGPDVHGLEATVERIASGPNIVRWARVQGWAGNSGEELGADYAAGVPIAVEAVTRSATAVGAALASATALVDLDVIVIGGGFSHVSADYLDLVREGRDRYAAYPFMARTAIVPAALGSESPLIGAAALVLRGVSAA